MQESYKPTTREIWENRKLIFQGIQNYFRKQEYIEDIAKIRKEACNNCEYLSTKCSLGISKCCALCGCDIEFKTRSPKALCPYPEEPKWFPIID